MTPRQIIANFLNNHPPERRQTLVEALATEIGEYGFAVNGRCGDGSEAILAFGGPRPRIYVIVDDELHVTGLNLHRAKVRTHRRIMSDGLLLRGYTLEHRDLPGDGALVIDVNRVGASDREMLAQEIGALGTSTV